jgi:hypothetical protein
VVLASTAAFLGYPVDPYPTLLGLPTGRLRRPTSRAGAHAQSSFSPVEQRHVVADDGL